MATVKDNFHLSNYTIFYSNLFDSLSAFKIMFPISYFLISLLENHYSYTLKYTNYIFLTLHYHICKCHSFNK